MTDSAPDYHATLTANDSPLPNDEMQVIVVSREEWEAHRQRVETLVSLLGSMVNALSQNPMFMAMIPPDVLAEMRQRF